MLKYYLLLADIKTWKKTHTHTHTTRTNILYNQSTPHYLQAKNKAVFLECFIALSECIKKEKIQRRNWVKTWSSCVLKIFGQHRNIHRKTLVLVSLFNKVTGCTHGDPTCPFSHATETCVIIGLTLQCKTIYQNETSLSFSDRSIYYLMVEKGCYGQIREGRAWGKHFNDGQLSADP